MNAELINPFIEATLNVLKTMASVDPKVGKPFAKPDACTWGDITGVIGMAGDDCNGNLMVSFDEGAICRIVSNMLMEEFPSITDEIVDAVGEITNVVCGNAKKALGEKGFSIHMASPVIVKGKHVELKQLAWGQTISIPFTIPEGGFVIETNLAKR